MDVAVVEWARRIPVDQIPAVLAFLTARLLGESGTCRNGESASSADNLLTASELAGRLKVPESWVRAEGRARKIPSFRLGRYIRFRLSDVERALSERTHQEAR
jgi:excisionase family DNA binding protein